MLIVSLWFFAGCRGENYNAEVYDTAIEWMTSDYIAENTTRNSSITESESAPITITNIIAIQSDFNNAFIEFPPEVDFEKEMLIIYFFTGDIIINQVTGDRIFSYKIKSINIANEKLNIVFTKKTLVSGPTGSPPTQECLVVKMDKTHVTATNIEIIYE